MNVSLNHIGDDPVNFKRSKDNIYLSLEVILMYITRFTSLEKKCHPLILCKKKLAKFEKNTSQLFRVSIQFGEIKSKVWFGYN